MKPTQSNARLPQLLGVGIPLLAFCVLTVWLGYLIGSHTGSDAATEENTAQKRGTSIRPKPATSNRLAMSQAAQLSFPTRSGASLQSIGKRFRDAASGSALVVDAEILALAAELEIDEITEAAQMVDGLPEPGRKQLLLAVLSRWATLDPEKATDFVLARMGEYDLREGLSTVFQSWGKSDPESALKRYLEMSQSGNFPPRLGISTTLSSLFFSWGQIDPEAAGRRAQELSQQNESFYPWVGIGALAATDEHRGKALTAAQAVEDKPAQVKALSRILSGWSKNDPKAAAQWIDENGYLDKTTEWAVSERYGRQDPGANIQWLRQRTPEDRREKTVGHAILRWAYSDVEAAAAWLDENGTNEPGIAAIAQYYSPISLDKSMEWAHRASPDNRDGVIATALAQARIRNPQVDLSAYLERGSVTREEMQAQVDQAYRRLQRF